MLHRCVLSAILLTVMVGNTAAQNRSDLGSEWLPVRPEPATGQSAEPLHLQASETPTVRRSLGTTLLGSVAGAAVTFAYFAIRDEDTYECNACVEKALVVALATTTGTAMGSRAAGAGTPRAIGASLAGTLVGTLVGLALIEPLRAGWPAGMIGYTLGQGLTAGMITHGGVR